MNMKYYCESCVRWEELRTASWNERAACQSKTLTGTVCLLLSLGAWALRGEMCPKVWVWVGSGGSEHLAGEQEAAEWVTLRTQKGTQV